MPAGSNAETRRCSRGAGCGRNGNTIDSASIINAEVLGKRRKTSLSPQNPASSLCRSRPGGGGSVNTATRERNRLLLEASKISSAGADSLQSFLDLVTCFQASTILKTKACSPCSFAGELLDHLLRLLPLAAASLDRASDFIKCLEPFEDLRDFVLPASFYRAIAAAKEPPPQALRPRGHNWKHKNDGALSGRARGSVGITAGCPTTPSQPPKVMTGLQMLREYLCMHGKDAADCHRRTVAATLTRALMGSWDGSVLVGRELFNQSVLNNPDRSDAVGLGLEVLLQCLVQDDGPFRQAKETDASDDEKAESSRSDDGDSGDSDTAAQSRTCHERWPRRRPTPTEAAPSLSSATTPRPGASSPSSSPAAHEARACVTIVGNYVRACGETSAAFFRDVLPVVVLMSMARDGRCSRRGRGRGRGGDGSGGSGRVPRRLAGLLRSLVESTRSRDSFNVERMIVHTMKEVKDWGDPATVILPLAGKDDVGGLEEAGDMLMGGTETDPPHSVAGGTAKASKRGSAGGGDKTRRRGLVLACLDVLGPTATCLSLIRREMVDGESKARLRSAVAEGLLEFRRTCASADADVVQVVLLGVLSSLVEDGVLGVRLAALSAIGEGCSSECVPAVSLLLKRCLDISPKVRALAVGLLVDEFRLGFGATGASLARVVISPPPPPATAAAAGGAWGNSNTGGVQGWTGGGGGDGSRRDGGGGVDAAPAPVLGELLRHRQMLEETDSKRFPVLLTGLVKAVLLGEGPLLRPSAAGHRGGTDSFVCEGGGGGGGSGSDDSPGAAGAAGEARPPCAAGLLLHPWCADGASVSWEDLDDPAGRLWAACRPSDPVQLDALDKVLGDIFSRRGGAGGVGGAG